MRLGALSGQNGNVWQFVHVLSVDARVPEIWKDDAMPEKQPSSWSHTCVKCFARLSYVTTCFLSRVPLHAMLIEKDYVMVKNDV